MSSIQRIIAAIIVFIVLTSGVHDSYAQSVLERTPNIQNGWIGESVQLNFNHRMWHMEIGGEQRLVASPTFLLGVPVTGEVLIAGQYASSSEVVEANEWEIFGRWAALRPGDLLPFGIAVTGGYNTAAQSGDTELSVNLPVANLQLLGSVRIFSDAYATGEIRSALGGGLLVRVSEGVALAGDVVALTEREQDEHVAWSAGLQLQIPRSPHTISFHATNAATTTLQGSSRGEDVVMWGFEFTTPLTFLE